MFDGEIGMGQDLADDANSGRKGAVYTMVDGDVRNCLVRVCGPVAGCREPVQVLADRRASYRLHGDEFLVQSDPAGGGGSASNAKALAEDAPRLEDGGEDGKGAAVENGPASGPPRSAKSERARVNRRRSSGEALAGGAGTRLRCLA